MIHERWHFQRLILGNKAFTVVINESVTKRGIFSFGRSLARWITATGMLDSTTKLHCLPVDRPHFDSILISGAHTNAHLCCSSVVCATVPKTRFASRIVLQTKIFLFAIKAQRNQNVRVATEWPNSVVFFSCGCCCFPFNRVRVLVHVAEHAWSMCDYAVHSSLAVVVLVANQITSLEFNDFNVHSVDCGARSNSYRNDVISLVVKWCVGSDIVIWWITCVNALPSKPYVSLIAIIDNPLLIEFEWLFRPNRPSTSDNFVFIGDVHVESLFDHFQYIFWLNVLWISSEKK